MTVKWFKSVDSASGGKPTKKVSKILPFTKVFIDELFLSSVLAKRRTAKKLSHKLSNLGIICRDICTNYNWMAAAKQEKKLPEKGGC